MAKTAKPDFVAILQTLVRHDVDFIVVGGVAATIQGASISTFDLDLVHSREPKNVGRLLKALEALDARYRTPGAGNLKPSRSHLESEGHQLLMTRAGPLDLQGIIGAHRGYVELLPETIRVKIVDVEIRVLALAAVIKTKEEAGREKDKATLAILRRTLEEKNRSGK
ncbi:MAG TPA: hypothetical protein VFM21_11765 [Terriglobia bacterium]|nr:hypothetical protein [Terriglobia bacterium]